MASSTDTFKNNRNKVGWILLKWTRHRLHLRSSKTLYALGFFVILSADDALVVIGQVEKIATDKRIVHRPITKIRIGKMSWIESWKSDVM
jgi:hypothetical protein